LALTALPIMMKANNVPSGVYTRNMVITMIALLYSVYALYASGGSAVMGGVLVLGITYIIWAFISNRFKGAGAALDRIKETGHVRFGYLPQAKPFTSAAASGSVEGYGAALCEKIAAGLSSQVGVEKLAVDWVPVTIDSAPGAVSSGQVDVLCMPANATLARRKSMSFSIPVFPGGIRAVVRNDITPQVREALQNNPRTRPV